MNLPNRLTLLRVIMIPFFVVFYMIKAADITLAGLSPGIAGIIALVLFIAASITDFLDGYIARKYNLVSDFGKLMDPLADKMLVTAALILLTWSGRLYAPVTVIIISREFVISGLRQLALEKGVVIAAGYLGKFKTTFQMVFIILMLTDVPQLMMPADICMWIALVLTVVSMVDYIIRNKELVSF